MNWKVVDGGLWKGFTYDTSLRVRGFELVGVVEGKRLFLSTLCIAIVTFISLQVLFKFNVGFVNCEKVDDLMIWWIGF